MTLLGMAVVLGSISVTTPVAVQNAVASSASAPAVQAPLPPGVKAVWNLDKAYREATTTRERVCLNGLWRWQPAKEVTDVVPNDGWGFFKVPAFWPGDSNYIQEDCQTMHVHPSWKGTNLRAITAAWYQREIAVPDTWKDRRIAISMEYLNSFAVIYVDGKKAGEIRFPAGELDITATCPADTKHTLSILVLAMPLKGLMMSFGDTNSAKEIRGSVERRGLCGDIYITGTPAAERITDVKVDTSVRQGTIAVHAGLENLAADMSYQLRAKISDKGGDSCEFLSKPFNAGDLRDGRISITQQWRPEKLWDTHTPQNMLDLQVSLVQLGPEQLHESRGSGTQFAKLVDVAYPVHFGFREFWIDGRDFYLNGTRIYLSAVPLDSAQLGARTASYEGARETMKRLKSFGINFVYTHNYGCQPGTHVSFTEILRAADDMGMLVALSQPHFGHYEWKTSDADRANGYAGHAQFYVRAAQNHPSVVAYSMSHNATGYGEDMNPDMIDGLGEPRTDSWSQNNAALALRAEAIVKQLDPTRIIYHHSSGNLGSMHTVNFYANFVPVQEMSDWFEHWSMAGVKPVFLCEYGVPFSWDWTMYRGWYKGERNFGSAKVPWEFCVAEWNAQFVGDRAFRISEREKQNLRFEAKQFRAGNLWHRWDYPHQVGSRDFDEREEIFANYITDNWRAHRTWGLSANSPWEYQIFWKPRDGAGKGRTSFAVDWESLQKPGFSPDYTQRQQSQMTTDFEHSDWIPSASAQALIRNNRPILAYLGGKPAAFTSKDHNFLPGETFEKQLIVINNSRETVSCDCTWSLRLASEATAGAAAISKRGSKNVIVPTGGQERIPLKFELPATLAAGKYELRASVQFSTGETQTDSFTIHVLPQPLDLSPGAQIALLDPKGETGKLLAELKVPFRLVDVDTDLSGYDVLIVGKGAMTVDGPGPDVDRVRDGLKVIVFEQTGAVLEQRFGFRVAEYGLRQVFARVPDHPVLAGIDQDHLRDWHGEATTLPPRLRYVLRPRYGPTVSWCGIDVPRIWRCGCRGNVASVLIERPSCGDFLSIIDGGYGLQYSPLLEFREGKGLVLFCQLDVNGRTERDPAADMLARSIVRYVAAWKPPPSRIALYVGDPAGKTHLESTGLELDSYSKEKLSADCVLIAGPGASQQLAGDAASINKWIEAGGNLLAIGLDDADAHAFLSSKITMKKQEHIAAYFEPPGLNSLLTGIGPADVHNRDPRELPLVSGGASRIGNGILAKTENANVVFCQLVPWQFESDRQMNLKRTFRRASCLVTRLVSNMGVASSTPALARFHHPPRTLNEKRWLIGLYLDVPEEWDDPYRFFRW